MDNEFMGERRRGLEEAYFAKKNRALLERLRAAAAPATDSVEGRATAVDEGRRGLGTARRRTFARLLTLAATLIAKVRSVAAG